jgi:hypothetical protein
MYENNIYNSREEKYFYEINEIDSFIKAEMLDKDENQFKSNEDIKNIQHIDSDDFNCEISDKEEFQYFFHSDDYPKDSMKKENSKPITKTTNDKSNENMISNGKTFNTSKIQTQGINMNEKNDLDKCLEGKNTVKYDKCVKIFKISKCNRKVGRLKKNTKIRFGIHNKFSEDNIIRKIKANFIKKFMNYINWEYRSYLKSINHKRFSKLLQKISPFESRKIKKEDNLKWFSSKLKDIYSSDISMKCCLHNSDYNKRKIESLYKDNKAKKIIGILEKNVRDMYEYYKNDNKIEGLETLEDDLNNIRTKMIKEGEEDIELYLETYKKIAQNLENIFICKRGRQKKSH